MVLEQIFLFFSQTKETKNYRCGGVSLVISEFGKKKTLPTQSFLYQPSFKQTIQKSYHGKNSKKKKKPQKMVLEKACGFWITLENGFGKTFLFFSWMKENKKLPVWRCVAISLCVEFPKFWIWSKRLCPPNHLCINQDLNRQFKNPIAGKIQLKKP